MECRYIYFTVGEYIIFPAYLFHYIELGLKNNTPVINYRIVYMLHVVNECLDLPLSRYRPIAPILNGLDSYVETYKKASGK